MATILHKGKRLPTIKNGKIGYWILLNGEDVTGGFDGITNEEYEKARDNHLSSLTEDYIKSLTAPIIEEKKEIIHAEIQKLKAVKEINFFETLSNLVLGQEIKEKCFLLMEERGLWTEEKWFSNDISDISVEEQEEIKEQITGKKEVQVQQKREAKAKLINQLEVLLKQDNIWSALQLLGIEKQQPFSLKKPLNEDDPNWNTLKAIVSPSTFLLGKNEVYARLVLIRNGVL